MRSNEELNENEHICNAKQGGLMVTALFLGEETLGVTHCLFYVV